ncbi:hypothetical protein ACH0CP_15870 [Sphingomonas sp. 179-I 2A4 NHS]|uniref:hypothetical protein n=1 Tax=unclassified Sphingomonas TaxID=196159 RepID=UPI0038791A27
MSRIPYAVRIDGRYAFRRRIHFRNFISKPITLALRTSDPRQARRLAAILAARFVRVKVDIDMMLEDGRALTGTEIEAIFRQKLEEELSFYVHSAYENAPWSSSVPEVAAQEAQAYRILRLPDRNLGMTEADRARLIEQGLGHEIPMIEDYIRQAVEALNDEDVSRRLASIGAPAHSQNIAAARAHLMRASAAACSRIARVFDEDTLEAPNPVRALISDLGDMSPEAKELLGRASHTPLPGVTAAQQPESYFFEYEPRRFSEIIDEVIAELTTDGTWKRKPDQQRRVMETFAWITGDRPLGSYNHKDPQMFKRGIQMIPARGFRFGSLREGNMSRPFAEVVAELPPLTPDQRRDNVTVNRDLSFMTTVAKHLAKSAWRPKTHGATVLDFAAERLKVRKENNRDGDGSDDLRPAWSKEHLECLFRSPLYTGGGGALHRLIVSNERRCIWHDAAYFAPLLWFYHHACREEICGLRVDEVTGDHPTPHFHIKNNDVRGRDGELAGEKRSARRRKLPIHPELIRLGFLDYVDAIRREGHAALFPELYLLSEKRGGAHFYERAWKHMATYISDRMPVPKNERGKGPDIHSIRSLGSGFYEVDGASEIMLADVMGHARKTVNGKHYSKRLSTEGPEVVLAERLRFIVKYVPVITGHLEPAPIQLLPLHQRSRVGSARDRKVRSDARKATC